MPAQSGRALRAPMHFGRIQYRAKIFTAAIVFLRNYEMISLLEFLITSFEQRNVRNNNGAVS